jgi:hypothetical protein
LDCKGKNYFSNKKAFIFFLAKTWQQNNGKSRFYSKKHKKRPTKRDFTVLNNIKL